MEILLWIWLLTWMAKTAAQDVLYAVSGKPNPRYELKKRRAQAAGQQWDGKPRYGARDWAADLWSDALAAHTERRRGRSEQTPVDDMVDVVADPHPQQGRQVRVPQPTKTPPIPNPPKKEEPTPADDTPQPITHTDQHPYCATPCGPHCPASRPNHGWNCGTCGTNRSGFASHDEAEADAAKHPCKPAADQPIPPEAMEDLRDTLTRLDPHRTWDPVRIIKATTEICQRHNLDSLPVDRAVAQLRGEWPPPGRRQPRLATVIPFPNTRKIKEATMNNNPEATGLPTAIAYAEAAADGHRTFATAGSEGYVGALERMGMTGEAIASAREAQEASTRAAEMWEQHKDHLAKQLSGREFYQSNPDAANKEALLAE